MKDVFLNKKNKNSTETPLENIRILLWDIDGTLLRSTVMGGYIKYFSAAMRRVYGSAGEIERVEASGKTDTQIMFEALKNEGFRPEQIFERTDELLKTFKTEMLKFLASGGEPYEALAGAREILTETDRRPDFINALLTGNLSVAAEIKLRAVGLWHFFENSPNAFGEISHERKDLAAAAGRLFRNAFDFDFAPEQFIVIGDTPNDVACARHFGARSVAVLTGRGQTRDKLETERPDVLIEDLTDTRRLLEIFSRL
jgi:phosphoglycolate phosphatase